MFYEVSEFDRDEGVATAKLESLNIAVKKIKRVLSEFGVNAYRYNYIIGSAYFLVCSVPLIVLNIVVEWNHFIDDSTEHYYNDYLLFRIQFESDLIEIHRRI